MTLTPIDGTPPGYKKPGLTPIEGTPKGYYNRDPAIDYEQIPVEEQYGSLKPNTMERVGRGLADLYQGTGQMAGSDEYDAQVQDEIARYERYAGEEFDWGRLGGQVAGGILAAAAVAKMGIPAFLAAKGVPAWAVAGLGGAAETGSLAVTQGESRLMNAVKGGVGGVAGYKLLNTAGKWGGKLWNKVRSMGDRGNPEEAIISVLREQGIDWNQLDDGLKQAMREDVDALIKGGADPTELTEQAVRKNIMEAEGLTPTRARVSRDPMDFSAEENLRKAPGGESLQDIRKGNLRQLHKRGDEVAAEIGPDTSTVDAGKALAGVIDDTRAYHKAIEDEAYNAARKAAGGDVPVRGEAVERELAELSYTFTPDEIGTKIYQQITDFSEDPSMYTVDAAERMIQRINAVLRAPANPQQGMVMQRLKKAIVADLDAVGDDGAEAARAWQNARKEVFQRRGMAGPKATRSKPEIIERVLEKTIAADDIVKAVKNAKVEELKAMMDYINSGSLETRVAGHKAIGKIRRAIVDDIMERVRPMQELGGFSGATFQKELRKLGPEKLEILFPKQGDMLKRLAAAATIEGYAPPLNAINYSNSGIVLGNMARKVLGLMKATPVINPLGEGVEGVVNRRAARGAIRNVLGAVPEQTTAPLNTLGAAAAASGAMAGAGQY
jgi:hypothetical protein